MRIPVLILTGFLGAGKTTLLGRALRSPRLARALVVINEIGEIGIDHHLVREVREDSIVLESGCACCTIRTELGETLARELTRGDRTFDQIVVETTGLAEPGAIVAALFGHPLVAQLVELSAIVTVVDAVVGVQSFEIHPEARAQVMVADELLISKTEVATPEQVEQVIRAVAALNPRIRPSRTTERDLDALFDPARYSVSAIALDHEHHEHHEHHTDDVRTFSVVSNRATSAVSVMAWLTFAAGFHGHSLLRVKGLLFAERHERPLVLQSVQHVVQPFYHLPAWPTARRQTSMVVITRSMSPTLFASVRTTLEQAIGA